MRKIVLLFVFGFFTLAAQAQTKIGYADVDYIFSEMPEAKQIEADLKTLQTQLKTQLDGKIAKFQKELEEYQRALQAGTMPDAVRTNTERELQQQQQNIEKLQQDAQTNVQNKHNQLMDPVYKRVGKAIEETAKDNGYTFILSQQLGGLDVLLYADETADISDLVLKKLGVTPKPATTQAAPAQTPATQTPPAQTPKKK